MVETGGSCVVGRTSQPALLRRVYPAVPAGATGSGTAMVRDVAVLLARRFDLAVLADAGHEHGGAQRSAIKVRSMDGAHVRNVARQLRTGCGQDVFYMGLK